MGKDKMGDYDTDAGGGLPLPAILAIGALFFLYVFVIEPLMSWAKENPLLFMGMAAFTVVIVILLALSFLMVKMQESRGSRGIEGGQVSYHGSGQSGSGIFGALSSTRQHHPAAIWKPHGIHTYSNLPDANLSDEYAGKRREQAESKEKISVNLPQAVAEIINNFQPAGGYEDEFAYRTELKDFLKKAFPKLDVVLRTAHALPNITVEKIAIEIRQHADENPVNALLEKCPKYAKAYRDLVVVVIEPRFSEEKYEKSLSSMKKSFENILLVLKY